MPNFKCTAVQFYRVCNAAGQCDTAAIYIRVTDSLSTTADRAPIAQNDIAQILMGKRMSGSVLSNDIDPNGKRLSAQTTLITSPMNGGVLMNFNGSFVYQPNDGFAGQDTFTYQICNSRNARLCDTAQARKRKLKKKD